MKNQNPPVKRRINSESELLAKIDALQAVIKKKNKMAAYCDHRASAVFRRCAIDSKTSHKDAVNCRLKQFRGMKLRNLAEKYRYGNRNRVKRMARLSEKLAEIRTGILPGIVPDGSVCL